jgi:uncharacterized membrane protein
MLVDILLGGLFFIILSLVDLFILDKYQKSLFFISNSRRTRRIEQIIFLLIIFIFVIIEIGVIYQSISQ